jgi:hypothetical protein
MQKRLEETVDDLTRHETRIWKSEDIEGYFREQGIELDRNTKLTILERLADIDVWRWILLTAHWLDQVASTEERFLCLLDKIVQKLKGDLAGGQIANALYEIGVRDSVLGFSLHREMARRNTELIYYSSYPLSGASGHDFRQSFIVVKQDFESNDPILRAASVRTLGKIFEKEGREPEEVSEAFALLKRAANIKESIAVRVASAIAYMVFSRFDPIESANQLMKLAGQSNPSIRFAIAYELCFRDLPDAANEINVLRYCAQDDNRQVLSQVCLALSIKGKQNPRETLKIMKDWIKEGKYFDVSGTDNCLREIGTDNFSICISDVENWIENERDQHLIFYVPIILKDLCSNNYRLLTEWMRTWVQKGLVFQDIIVRTLKQILGIAYFSKAKDQSLIDTCFSILTQLCGGAENLGETKTRRWPVGIPACFKLIRKVENQRLKLDFEKIRKNLEYYPVIRRFLCEDWFEERMISPNKKHPLLIVLSYRTPNPNDVSAETAFLNHLEGMLKLVFSIANGLEDLRDGLRNDQQFSKTISEMEFVSAFTSLYHVEIAPNVGRKRLDAKISIDGSEILVEVFSPEPYRPLEYAPGPIEVKSKASDKIYREFRKHLKDISITVDTPIVIVLDSTRSGITQGEVEDALMGTTRGEMVFDSVTGRFFARDLERVKDSIHYRDQKTDVLSAVICYRSYVNERGIYRLKGAVVPNPFARNPLTKGLIKKIDTAMFDTTIFS